MNMRRQFRMLLVSTGFLVAITLQLFAQATPVLDQGYAGSLMVSGRASPDRIPLTIYDASHQRRTALGVSKSIDREGNFAVAIAPALILSHTIIVVDSAGDSSPAMTVVARPSSPAHQ